MNGLRFPLNGKHLAASNVIVSATSASNAIKLLRISCLQKELRKSRFVLSKENFKNSTFVCHFRDATHFGY